jgi:hypothetical protein
MGGWHMTIETPEYSTNVASQESIRIPIGKLGHHISVPSLKLFFEQKAAEDNSPERTPSSPPYKLKQIRESEADRKATTQATEILTPSFSPTTEESPHTVRFGGDDESESDEDSLKQKFLIDISKVPSFKDLQYSITPRGSSMERHSPPPIRRDLKPQNKNSPTPSGFSTPQTQRKNPLSSPRRRSISCSTGNIPNPPKGGGFSPRQRISKLHSKKALKIRTGFYSPTNEKLTNDDWIIALPDQTKERKRFNKSAIKFIQSHLVRENTPKPSLENIKNKLDNFIKLQFDKILCSDASMYDQNPLNMNNSSGSPRSTIAMRFVLELIQENRVLTKWILSPLLEMKKGLIEFLESKKKKTDWTMTLANLLSNLIYYDNDLKSFMQHIDKITDKQIVNLLQTYIDHGLFNFIREYVDEKSHLLLRGDLASIHLGFHEALGIHTQKQWVWEPQDALFKFSDVTMKNITQGFVSYEGLRLERLTINRQSVDTRYLVSGGIESKKKFFTDFLRFFYQASKKEISQEELIQEVEDILNDKDVLSKELLSLCVVPWKHFYDAIRLLYPGLQCGIATVPEEGKSRIHIDVESDGTYRIIRDVTYSSYQLRSRSKGSSHLPDFKRPIGSINFRWTITPCFDENELRTWSGCIQIPKSLEVKKHTSYEMKWKILRSLIDYVEVDDQMTVSRVPIIDDENLATKFNQEVYETFDRPEEFVNVSQPSAFTLEFLVKNHCRQELIQQLSPSATISSEEIYISELADIVWENLKVNGQVLEPLLLRLSVFEEKLRRYLMIKTKRTPWTDKLMAYLKELLLSTKYAEYGIPIVKDLTTFLQIIEKDIKDPSIRQLLLNVMCGRWENYNGTRDEYFQDQHIGEIMGTLQCVRDSSKFLKPALKEMLEEQGRVSEHGILTKKHEWIEPSDKRSPISSIDVKQIVRCFMQYTQPIFNEVTINGVSVISDGLKGDVTQMQTEYFERLLKAIYIQYDPSIEDSAIKEQATYMVNYEKSDGETKALASKIIPCLEILRLCANSCWMIADIFIRNLYDINNPPIKSNMLQGMSCCIEINSKTEFSVEHRRCYGIYPRETPDNISSNRILKSECLAKIPFSWTLSPYMDDNRKTHKGIFQVTNLIIRQGILPEYKAQILKSLHDHHSSFMEEPNWEDHPKEPQLHMPLTTAEGKRLPIISPRYTKKRPKTPRG